MSRADRRRSGERHERDARIGDERTRAALSAIASVKIGGSAISAITRFASAARRAPRAASSATASRPSRCRRRGEHRVPRPDGDREVERRDDADDAERMPLLVHPVRGALGVHRLAVEHPRLADGEVGDVDHLLHFAVAFGLDLAVLERDERAERVLVLAQQVAEAAHHLAAPRRGHVAPCMRGRKRPQRSPRRDRPALRGGDARQRAFVRGITDRSRRRRRAIGRARRQTPGLSSRNAEAARATRESG